MPLGLYIHVPFCRSRCHFCAFYLEIYRDDRAQSFLTALSREMQLHVAQQPLGGRRLDSVYFGGGTPTALRTEDLCDILSGVRTNFGLTRDAEITIEAHPDTVAVEGLRALSAAGFNRISFGVQSLDEKELTQIGRPVLSDTTHKAIALARQTGFTNINLDLMYGLPGQTLDSWLETVDHALALEPTHLSCYALTVENNTRLIVDIRRGTRDNPEELLQNAMENEAARRLAGAGFHHYEISNYSRPGYTCRHNRLYWENGEYLGMGPSAQSYLAGDRFGNIDDLDAYEDRLANGVLPIVDRESLGAEQRQRETVVFGLRLIDGVPTASLPIHEEQHDWTEKITRLIDDGYLETAGDRVKLTAKGRRFADSIAVDLL
jgi:putative oxygen-independent coproporphyrinogen III oxidase